MSAKSRSRRPIIQLPLKRDDFIDAMTTMEDGGETFVLVHTHHDRVFYVRRVARYKRPYKVYEIARPASLNDCASLPGTS